MNIVIYANCQGAAIKKFLDLLLSDLPINVQNFENYKLINGEESFSPLSRAAKVADFFIYQPIDRIYGLLSTDSSEENSLTSTPNHCKLLSFPYVYNNGLWPIYHETVPQNCDVFSRMFSAGAELEDAFRAYDSGDMTFNIKARIFDSLNILRSREENLDIKISEFIADNIFDKRLFLTQNHPTTEVFLFILKNILDWLGVKQNFEWDSIRNYGNNYAELPGQLPIDRYCIEEGGVKYASTPDVGAADFYKALIRSHYLEWSRQQVPFQHP